MKISDSLVTVKDKYTIHSKQCGRNKLYANYMPREIILDVELIYMHRFPWDVIFAFSRVNLLP